MNKELLDYLRSEARNNTDPDEIRLALLNSGYDDATVDGASAAYMKFLDQLQAKDVPSPTYFDPNKKTQIFSKKNLKRMGIIGGAALAAVLLSAFLAVTILGGPKNCLTQACFKEKALKCEEAVFTSTVNMVGAPVQVACLGGTPQGCDFSVVVKDGFHMGQALRCTMSSDDMAAIWKNKALACQVCKGDLFDANNFC